MTNRLVDGGHWLVAAFFAVEGLGIVWRSVVMGLVDGLSRSSRGEPVSFYPVYMGVLSSVVSLLCAWGIFKWQLWAHYLALFLSTLDFIAVAAALCLFGSAGINVTLVLALLVAGSILAWLLLPSVRAEYTRRALAV